MINEEDNLYPIEIGPIPIEPGRLYTSEEVSAIINSYMELVWIERYQKGFEDGVNKRNSIHSNSNTTIYDDDISFGDVPF